MISIICITNSNSSALSIHKLLGCIDWLINISHHQPEDPPCVQAIFDPDDGLVFTDMPPAKMQSSHLSFGHHPHRNPSILHIPEFRDSQHIILSQILDDSLSFSGLIFLRRTWISIYPIIVIAFLPFFRLLQ